MANAEGETARRANAEKKRLIRGVDRVRGDILILLRRLRDRVMTSWGDLLSDSRVVLISDSGGKEFRSELMWKRGIRGKS